MFPPDATPRTLLRSSNWALTWRLVSLEWALWAHGRTERQMLGERRSRFTYHRVLRRTLRTMIRLRETQLRRKGIDPARVMPARPKKALPVPAVQEEPFAYRMPRVGECSIDGRDLLEIME